MKPKPKIAFMTYAVDGRLGKGTAVVARKTIEAFLRSQDQFDLTFMHYEQSDDPIYSHGVREVLFPTFRFGFFNRRFIRQIYYFLTTKDRFDVIQWFQPRLYPFFWLAPARYIVATLHGAGDLGKENAFNLMRHVFNWTLKLCNGRVDAAIAGSAYARDDIIKRYRFSDPSKVHVVHMGVDASFAPAPADVIARVKKKYQLPEKFFLNVARLNPGKNAFRTIRAFDRFIQAQKDAQIDFVNIGAYGTDKVAVESFIEKSVAKERIHLVGYVDAEDLSAVYSAAFALVFPLLNEGFGLPILEAMACGTPVIASDTATPGIERDEALLVDALSEEAIAEAMQTMYEHDDLRMKLIEKGRAKAPHFSWEQSGKNVIAIHKKLLAK